ERVIELLRQKVRPLRQRDALPRAQPVQVVAMRDYLFIYGTLLPGHVPPEMAATCRRLRHVGPATARGRLYDLGPYPAAILDDGHLMHGELVEVDHPQTWRELDQYEGCPRPGDGSGLFQRVRTTAVLQSGGVVDCWIYVYNRDL